VKRNKAQQLLGEECHLVAQYNNNKKETNSESPVTYIAPNLPPTMAQQPHHINRIKLMKKFGEELPIQLIQDNVDIPDEGKNLLDKDEDKILKEKVQTYSNEKDAFNQPDFVSFRKLQNFFGENLSRQQSLPEQSKRALLRRKNFKRIFSDDITKYNTTPDLCENKVKIHENTKNSTADPKILEKIESVECYFALKNEEMKKNIRR